MTSSHIMFLNRSRSFVIIGLAIFVGRKTQIKFVDKPPPNKRRSLNQNVQRRKKIENCLSLSTQSSPSCSNKKTCFTHTHALCYARFSIKSNIFFRNYRKTVYYIIVS